MGKSANNSTLDENPEKRSIKVSDHKEERGSDSTIAFLQQVDEIETQIRESIERQTPLRIEHLQNFFEQTRRQIAEKLLIEARLEECRQALRELQQTSFELEKLFNYSPNMLCVMTGNDDDHFLRINPSFMRILGYEEPEVLARPFLHFVHPDDKKKTIEAMRSPLEDSQVVDLTNRYRTKDGSYRYLEWAIFHDSESNMRYAVAHDVTLKHIPGDLWTLSNIDDDMEGIQAQLDLLLGAIVDYEVIMLDPQGYIMSWNTGAQRIKGYTSKEIVGKHFSQFYPSSEVEAEVAEHHLRIAKEAGKFEEKGWRIRKDGTRFFADILINPVKDKTGRLLGFAKITRDISKENDLEEQLRHAQKMQEMGQMASGIAHDFNNLLIAIMGYAELLSVNLTKKPQKIPLYLNEIKKASERAANLTRQLLTFSRKQIMEPKIIQLDNLISDIEKLLKTIIPENIESVIRLAGTNSWKVKVDPGQLEQVIVNLVVNAHHAMPEGGKITIETQNVILDETYAQKHFEVTPGEYVMLAISDTGCGMTDEIKNRIFEPFFTTKEKDKGTGLGLSIVYGIVKQCGGDIWVYSEPGEGTTFKMYFPRSKDEEEEENTTTPGPGIIPGGETILIVEDDQSVRDTMKMILEEIGYTIQTAENGKKALELIDTTTVHGVITDVIMPGMSGPSLIKTIRERTSKDIKIIMMSGYTEGSMDSTKLLSDWGVVFLGKPFNANNLINTVQKLLHPKKNDSSSV